LALGIIRCQKSSKPRTFNKHPCILYMSTIYGQNSSRAVRKLILRTALFLLKLSS
jgi:hypothetical protein